MKAINIIGIIFGVAIIPLSIYYIEETSSARWAAYDFFESYSTYFGPSAQEVTLEGSSICMLIGLFFIYQIIMNLVKIKTITTKVLAIISLSIIGLGLLINLAMIGAGGTFDEGGQLWMIEGLIMIAFSIVFLVQAVNFDNNAATKSNTDVIDDIV